MPSPVSSSTADGRPVSPLTQTIDALDVAILRLSQRMNTAEYELACLLCEFDDRLGWAKWSFRNCAEWLAWRCGLSISAAREKVRTAQALRDLPAISKAFAEGRLSYSKVRALTRVATAHDEDLLLAYALDATAAQVEERCRQLRFCQPDSSVLATRAWERRSASVSRNRQAGTLTLHAELPLEVGELLVQALERAVEAGRMQQGPELETTSWSQQQADALVELARAYLGGGQHGATAAADHYQVVVHVDDAALRGGPGRADLPIETLRRLGCDGSIVRIVDDDNGAPLDVGRKTRTVTAALKRALWSRDRGCSFPGCERSHYVDAHHIEHWAQGGATSLENLMLLCTYHHRLLHEGGFSVKRDREGALRFKRPDGRVIPRNGYRIEDVVDEGCSAGPLDAGLLAALVRSRKPSAEVREPAGVYLVPNSIAALHSAASLTLSSTGRIHAGGPTSLRCDRLVRLRNEHADDWAFVMEAQLT